MSKPCGCSKRSELERNKQVQEALARRKRQREQLLREQRRLNRGGN